VFTGVFSGPVSTRLPALTMIAITGTLVEMLPLKDVDNITVTIAALVTGHIFL